MLVAAKIISAVLVVIGSMSFVGYSQLKIDALHEEALTDELLYIPNKSLLTHFTAGMSNVVADLLWLETIQYTVQEFHSQEQKFTWLDQMINAVVDLDPNFVGAYANGSMFLSSIGADDKALDLLKKGFVQNPESWEIPHEIVKLYVLNRRDRPESPAVTTHYLRMLAERHEYPELYLNWARHIQERNDLKYEARAIWEDVIAKSDDKFVRKMAQANLTLLIIRENVDTLDDLASRFETQFHRPPTNMQEMIDAGLLAELPTGAQDGEYFLDREGKVQNSVLLEDTRKRMLMSLNGKARLRAKEMGRKAANLDEWVEWTGEDLPKHPLPDGQWLYDPSTGQVS